MNNTEKSTVRIKSNVNLKSRGILKPIDNMPREYFDVRSDNRLTTLQREMKERMLYWADKIYDDSGNLVNDECHKGCLNCGDGSNNCQRTQNKFLKLNI